MEGKEAVKMEASNRGSSLFPDHIPSSFTLHEVFDHLSETDYKTSLGFMELLGVESFNSASPFDTPKASFFNTASITPELANLESPEGFNKLQATPNSCSVISSESSEAINDEPTREEDMRDRQEGKQKAKKQLKVKKTNEKRQKQPRFAFMTKSEVDHLEDGYRWRKYGQKAVKHSPFPRSYYRCTTASCNVKKRVERCFRDPSVVVTTYEGKHTHPSPLMPRPISLAGGGHDLISGAAAAFGMQMQMNNYQQYLQLQGLQVAPSVHSPPPTKFEDFTAGSGFLQDFSPCDYMIRER